MCSWYLLQSKLRNLKWPHSNCLSRLDVERRDTWQKEQQGNMKKRYCHPRSRTSELYRQNCCDCPVSRVGLWPVPEDSHGTGSTILGKLIWSSFATLSRGLSFLIWQEENLDVGRWASSPARHSPSKKESTETPEQLPQKPSSSYLSLLRKEKGDLSVPLSHVQPLTGLIIPCNKYRPFILYIIYYFSLSVNIFLSIMHKTRLSKLKSSGNFP